MHVSELLGDGDDERLLVRLPASVDQQIPPVFLSVHFSADVVLTIDGAGSPCMVRSVHSTVSAFPGGGPPVGAAPMPQRNGVI